jgi:hypothetical protein
MSEVTDGQGVIRWRELGRDRLGEFMAKGHRERSFFPHRALFLPRPGPDGYKLARWMCGEPETGHLWELVLFAEEEMLHEFPRDLFFDHDLVWHGQHLGRPGHIAYADVVVAGEDMWSMSHVSDLVQRIGRRREHKTRIENRFKGWPDLVLNALLAFGVERGVRRLHVPTSTLQIKNTDPKRTVQPELFERVYDRCVNRLLRTSRAGDWWVVDIEANRDRLVVPSVREEPLRRERTVCICHDVEAGLGHVGIDKRLVARATASWRGSVAAMLEHEATAGISGTYNVVGQLLPDVRAEIEAGRHCLAFHSYDHRLPRGPTLPKPLRRLLRGPRTSRVTGAAPRLDQLSACRRVDYRLKGYRVPRSRLTADLSDENVLFHNFEWVASSAFSLGFAQPRLRNGVVWIAVHMDDYALYRRGQTFESWREETLAKLAPQAVAVVSLHDCYADLWLPQYDRLLAELRELGEVRTLDEVAADVLLASSA